MERVFLVIKPGMFGQNFDQFVLSLLLEDYLIEVVDSEMCILNQSLQQIGLINSPNNLILAYGTVNGLFIMNHHINFPYYQIMVVLGAI